jgi:hypothetical protein
VGLSGFAAVGAWGLLNEANGVAYSPDFGITYSATNISVLRADTRYGAFPSATNWYITAGDWPGVSWNAYNPSAQYNLAPKKCKT